MSKLPTSWAWTTIDEIASTSSGGTPSRARPDYYGGSIPWVKSGELNDGVVSVIEETITDDGLKYSSAKIFAAGTLCIALYGATVGKVGILSVDAATNQAVCGIRPDRGINTKYLFYFLQSQRSALIGLSVGGAQPNISQQIVRSTVLPICAPPEQDRIVAEIEKQFTRLDAATAALKRARANLKRYRASVLKAACEGLLVPTEAELARKESRDYEPADKLLQRILRERRARWEADTLAKMQAAGTSPKDDHWKQKYKEPARPDTSNHPPLPDGWVCVSLDTIADVIDPNPSHRTPKYVEHGFAFVSAENFVGDRSVDFRIGRQVGRDVLTEQIERFPILPGAFAMSRYGTIGKTCRLPAERTYCLSYSLVVIQSTSSLVDSDFLRLVCSSGMIMALAQSRIQGAAIPDLGVAHIRSLPIAFPAREEQLRINEEAARKLSVVDRMVNSISQQMLHADRLRQSVLRCAFTGQLVSQDPTDELASALLERIRAERNGCATKSATRRDSLKELSHARIKHNSLRFREP